MEIRFFETLPSTQLYLTEAIRAGEIKKATAVIARMQTEGVGSRANRWIGREGNFFASVALPVEELPADLPIASASIYFAFLMKEVLQSHDGKVWVKWPNDLYRGEGKIGGVVTHRLKNFFVAGLGVNLKKEENFYEALSTELSPIELLDLYLERLAKRSDWKSIFRKYRLEFAKSRRFSVHVGAERKSLERAHLMEDGSLVIDQERIWGTR
ncbi:biotin--[acetyl-CoA-carboxylase] ligase [Nitratifractor sp.]